MLAVEMRTEPTVLQLPPLLTQNPPAICTTGFSYTTNLFDWESGAAGWTVSRRDVANPGTFLDRDWTIDATLPGGRSGSAFSALDPTVGDCTADDETGVLVLESPTFVMPFGGAVPRLDVRSLRRLRGHLGRRQPEDQRQRRAVHGRAAGGLLVQRPDRPVVHRRRRQHQSARRRAGLARHRRGLEFGHLGPHDRQPDRHRRTRPELQAALRVRYRWLRRHDPRLVRGRRADLHLPGRRSAVRRRLRGGDVARAGASAAP